MKNSDKTISRWEWILLGLIFTGLLIFNCMTPMLADDYIFSLNRATSMRIERFGEIFECLSQLRGSVYGNGRVVAHFFAQLFLLLPGWIFDIVNSLSGCLVFILMYRLVRRGRAGRDAAALFLSLSLLWLTMPAWGQVFLWLTGACNYCGTVLFSLLFLTPFFAAQLSRPELELFPRKTPAVTAARLLIGFIAGAYSENGAFSMLGVAFLLMAVSFARDRKLPDRSLLLSFAAACGGFLFLMLCPAELLGRTGNAGDSSIITNLSALCGRLAGLTGGRTALLAAGAFVALALSVFGCVRSRGFRAAFFALAPTAVYIAAAVFFRPQTAAGEGFFAGLLIFLNDTKEALLFMFFLSYILTWLGAVSGVEKKLVTLSAVLILGGLASVLIFVFAAYFPPRSAAYASVYTALADIFMLTGLYDRGNKKPFKGFVCAAALLFALSLVPAAADIASSTAMGRQRNLRLEQAAESGQGIVYLEAIMPKTKYSPFWPGDADYFNGDICLYFGLDQVAISEYALTGE